MKIIMLHEHTREPVCEPSIDDLLHAVMTAVTSAVSHEGTVLGIGDRIDEIPEAIVRLAHATRATFSDTYRAVSKALHENWTRRVGTPGYKKALWMAVDRAIANLAHHVATVVGHVEPWIPSRVTRERFQ